MSGRKGSTAGLSHTSITFIIASTTYLQTDTPSSTDQNKIEVSELKHVRPRVNHWQKRKIIIDSPDSQTRVFVHAPPPPAKIAMVDITSNIFGSDTAR